MFSFKGYKKRIKELEMTVEELVNKCVKDSHKPDLLSMIQKICTHDYKGVFIERHSIKVFSSWHSIEAHHLKECKICGSKYGISEREYLELIKEDLVNKTKEKQDRIEQLKKDEEDV